MAEDDDGNDDGNDDDDNTTTATTTTTTIPKTMAEDDGNKSWAEDEHPFYTSVGFCSPTQRLAQV